MRLGQPLAQRKRGPGTLWEQRLRSCSTPKDKTGARTRRSPPARIAFRAPQPHRGAGPLNLSSGLEAVVPCRLLIGCRSSAVCLASARRLFFSVFLLFVIQPLPRAPAIFNKATAEYSNHPFTLAHSSPEEPPSARRPGQGKTTCSRTTPSPGELCSERVCVECEERTAPRSLELCLSSGSGWQP